jgi:pheromone a factor receptor
MDHRDFDASQLDFNSALYPVTFILPVVSLIVSILCLMPLIWLIRAHNLAGTSLVLWLLLLNSQCFINPLIWPTDLSLLENNYKGVVLCDIETKLIIGAWVGLPGSITSILMRLAKVLDVSRITIGAESAAEKRQKWIIEITLAWGLPILVAGLHVFVQPFRYYLYGIRGCAVPLHESWGSIILVEIWSPVILLLGAYYAGMLCLETQL